MSLPSVVFNIEADTSKLVSGMDRAEKSVKKSIDSIKTAVISMAAAYAGIESIKAFSGMITDSVAAADATGKLAQQLGFTTSAFSELQYAASYAGISNNELNAGLSALVRRLTNFQRSGGGAAAKAFEELGISAEYARENFTTTEIAFKEINKRLSEMPDGFRKTAIAQDIFSKSASGILKLSASDYEKFSKEARSIGLTISSETAQMAAAYSDQMDQLDARLKGIKRTISYSVIAPMDAASKTALDMYDAIFGDQKGQIEEFENIASGSILSVANSVGFIKDAFTGVEIVIKGAEIGFLEFVKAIQESSNYINSSFQWWEEKLNSATGKKTHFFETVDTESTIKLIQELKNDADLLTMSISDGRKASDTFTKTYLKNLKSIKEEAKKTYSSTQKITNAPIKKDTSKAENTQWIKDLQEFYSIDIDKGLNDQNKKVETTFEDWGKTLNSSISSAIVDALQSGDIGGALQGLGGSIGSSMLQSSTANLVAGGKQLDAAGGLMSMGGVYGMAAGVGINLLMSQFNQEHKSAEELKQEYFSKIDKQTDSIVSAIDSQTKILNGFGLDVEALKNTWLSSQKDYEGGITKEFYNLFGHVSNRSASRGVSELYKYDISKTSLSDLLKMSNITKGVNPAYTYDQDQNYGKNNNSLGYDNGKYGRTKYQDAWDDYLVTTVREKRLGGGYTFSDEFKTATRDYISSMLDVKDTYADLSDSLKDVYDSLNNDYYATKKLSDAQSKLDGIRGNKSISEYLYDTISGLDDFGTSITGLKDSLTSTDFTVQLDALQQLEAKTGESFGNNTAEALEYLDSIQLVGDAMAKSKTNIKTWEDSFKSSDELARDMAQQLGVSLATTTSGLNDLFESLKGGIGGLTDAELELLQANKDILAQSTKAYDDAYLGQYSPLSMLQKAEYANNIAHNSAITGGQTAIDDAYQALQAAAQTATRDEDITLAFNRYASLLQEQTEDSTRTDIVNEIMKSNEKLTDVIDRLERLEQVS